MAGAVVALVVATGAPDRTSRSQASLPERPATSAAPAPGAKPAPTQLSPEDTVRAFYTRAASRDVGGAYRLAGPGVRSQLMGISGFHSLFDSLRSVRFSRVKRTGGTGSTATVAFADVARHTDFTDSCRGSAMLRRHASKAWLLERLAIACQRT